MNFVSFFPKASPMLGFSFSCTCREGAIRSVGRRWDGDGKEGQEEGRKGGWGREGRKGGRVREGRKEGREGGREGKRRKEGRDEGEEKEGREEVRKGGRKGRCK